jgi:cobalamin biosynthesis protein CobT
VVTTTPTTDIVAWTVAVHNGAERVASTMDRQTDLFGMFIDKMRGMRAAVDRLSVSATSSSRVTTSMVADEEEDEQEQEGDVTVNITMGEVGNESGGDEEENEGGEGDNNDEEEGEEEKSGTGGAERDMAPEASTSLQVVDRPHVPQVAERPHVPCPQWRLWKDKGKGKMRWGK